MLFFHVWIIVIVPAIIVILVESGEKEESQKMDDLPVLATCWFGTLGMLSSQINGPVGNRSTQ